MAYNFALPRQQPNQNNYQNQQPQNGFNLPRTQPVTQGQQMAVNQNNQGLQTGNFADVQSAQGATDRANAQRTASALQATRGTFARSGVDTSPEAATRAQDQSFSAAEGQNINGTNAVNQLQRQYRTDAISNAGKYEQNALTQQQQGINNNQFQQTFAAGRQDAQTAKNQFGENLSQRQQEFGVTSGQSQQQIDAGQRQFLQSLGQRDKEFGVSSNQEQQKIGNQVDQFGQSLNQNQNQFNTTSGLEQQRINNQQNQFGVTSGQEQQKIGNQNTQFNLARGDSNSHFDTTSGLEQQRVNNQKDQFGQSLNQNQNQFNVTSAQEQQKIGNQVDQFGRSLNQNQNQFDITSGQNQQKISNDYALGQGQLGVSQQNANTNQTQVNNQNTQFGLKRGDDNKHFDTTSNQDQQKIDNQNSQFQTTSGQNQQQINNQVDQFGRSLNQNQSQFDVNSNQNQEKINNQDSQFTTSRNDQVNQFGQSMNQNQNQFNLSRTDRNNSTSYNQKIDQINAIQDPNARALAMKALDSGGDVNAAIAGNIDDKGQLINHQATPGAQAAQAKIDELKSYNPQKPGESPQAYNDRISAQANTERQSDYALSRGPANTAAETAATNASSKNLANLPPGQAPSKSDVDNLKSIPAGGAPIGADAVSAFLQNSSTGGWAKIDGEPYKIIGSQQIRTGHNDSGGYTHTDYTTMLDKNGNKVFIDPRTGKVTNKELKTDSGFDVTEGRYGT